MIRRLRWDLMDANERWNYWYWPVANVPGFFGNMLRARLLAPRMQRVGVGLSVMAGCRFRSIERLSVGDNVSIGFDNFFQALGGLRLGDNVVTAPGVKIWTVNHNIESATATVLEQGQSERAVEIGNDVFIGGNAFILPGVTLPDGCVVSAGSVVGVRVYKPNSILAGNPARVIGFRGVRDVTSDSGDELAGESNG